MRQVALLFLLRLRGLMWCYMTQFSIQLVPFAYLVVGKRNKLVKVFAVMWQALEESMNKRGDEIGGRSNDENKLRQDAVYKAAGRNSALEGAAVIRVTA